MYLVIGEKPSVSQTLAKVLGAGKRQDGYLSGADCTVICVSSYVHSLETA